MRNALLSSGDSSKTEIAGKGCISALISISLAATLPFGLFVVDYLRDTKGLLDFTKFHVAWPVVTIMAIGLGSSIAVLLYSSKKRSR